MAKKKSPGKPNPPAAKTGNKTIGPLLNISKSPAFDHSFVGEIPPLLPIEPDEKALYKLVGIDRRVLTDDNPFFDTRETEQSTGNPFISQPISNPWYAKVLKDEDAGLDLQEVFRKSAQKVGLNPVEFAAGMIQEGFDAKMIARDLGLYDPEGTINYGITSESYGLDTVGDYIPVINKKLGKNYKPDTWEGPGSRLFEWTNERGQIVQPARFKDIQEMSDVAAAIYKYREEVTGNAAKELGLKLQPWERQYFNYMGYNTQHNTSNPTFIENYKDRAKTNASPDRSLKEMMTFLKDRGILGGSKEDFDEFVKVKNLSATEIADKLGLVYDVVKKDYEGNPIRLDYKNPNASNIALLFYNAGHGYRRIGDLEGAYKSDQSKFVAAVPKMPDGGYVEKVRNLRGGKVRANSDGTTSTVLMTQMDNKAFPTLFYDEKKGWYELPFEQAYKEAVLKNEVFEFDSEDRARAFAEGSWKDIGIPNYETMDYSGEKKTKTRRALTYKNGGPVNPRIGHYGGGGFLAGMSGALGGASTGASIGAAIGGPLAPFTAIGGAIIGGITSIFKNKRKNDAEADALAKQEADRERLVATTNLANDNNALNVFPTKGVASAPFGLKEGGPAPAIFKAMQGGRLKKLAPGVFLAKGKPHSQGGIKGDTNFDGVADVEIEGNELYFENIGDNGFVVNKEIAKKFVPQFRKINGGTKTDVNTRNLLIERAIAENENRRARLGQLI